MFRLFRLFSLTDSYLSYIWKWPPLLIKLFWLLFSITVIATPFAYYQEKYQPTPISNKTTHLIRTDWLDKHLLLLDTGLSNNNFNSSIPMAGLVDVLKKGFVLQCLGIHRVTSSRLYKGMAYTNGYATFALPKNRVVKAAQPLNGITLGIVSFYRMNDAKTPPTFLYTRFYDTQGAGSPNSSFSTQMSKEFNITEPLEKPKGKIEFDDKYYNDSFYYDNNCHGNNEFGWPYYRVMNYNEMENSFNQFLSPTYLSIEEVAQLAREKAAYVALDPEVEGLNRAFNQAMSYFGTYFKLQAQAHQNLTTVLNGSRLKRDELERSIKKSKKLKEQLRNKQ